MDTIPRFIKHIQTAIINEKLQPKLLERISHRSLNPSLFWKLSRIPGALDLLHGIFRRSLLPDNSKEPCPVPSCSQHQNVYHVLTCNTSDHLAALGPNHRWADTSQLYSESPITIPLILDSFAIGHVPSLRLVATRMKFLSTDFLARRWSDWLLSCLRNTD